MNLKESWYFIAPKLYAAPHLIDSQSEEELPFVKLIRGEGNYNRFTHLIGDDTKHIFLSRVSDATQPDTYLSRYYEEKDNTRPSFDDGALPGTIELYYGR
jgi:hypothetical protein